ncbi:DUF1844 domain-containing protein [Dethiosulfatarculus sandiegensis]|uniref:DUF1844 domain-containing protein n=1 Tax=Dethiosulfatarculus sandiegensis TaxID=1429043 RepID=A0A0D2K2N2_9BACT|nr:DUF1844 domain-containing protein [Dethiosulfatarculus sandiegensis]KIX15890.1 hypothetical protein X474_01020 [Dethiosulfatarculus sandiegensis]
MTEDKTEQSRREAEEARAKKAKDDAEKASQKMGDSVFPPVDFSSFVLSLSHAAMMHLGQIPDPQTGETQTNVGFARHTIDTIAMLQEKTKGNLESDEKQLLDNILTELRLAFVRLAK